MQDQRELSASLTNLTREGASVGKQAPFLRKLLTNASASNATFRVHSMQVCRLLSTYALFVHSLAEMMDYCKTAIFYLCSSTFYKESAVILKLPQSNRTQLLYFCKSDTKAIVM